MRPCRSGLVSVAIALCFLATSRLHAQEEAPPPPTQPLEEQMREAFAWLDRFDDLDTRAWALRR